MITSIILFCQYVRSSEHLPRAGCRELLELCRKYFGTKFTLGRDRFYEILRANNMMLRRKRFRPRTTDSNHNNRIYPDLLNTSPKLVAKKAGELLVADITYVYCQEGFGYLSLLTDAYTRYIVGYSFQETLQTQGPQQALEMAISCFSNLNIDISGCIHHSDRGVQYTSKEYVESLKANNIQISMTQTGDPLHNALAERMNNTLKNSWLFNNGEFSFRLAKESITQAINMYNTARPHQALGMRTPYELISGKSYNPLLSTN